MAAASENLGVDRFQPNTNHASSINNENKNQDAATGKASPSTQTEMIPSMNRFLYNVAAKGTLKTLTVTPHAAILDRSLTPNKNTVLHIHITALSRETERTDFVEEILNQCPSLLLQVNVKGETPLHIAARYGHARIVKVLIESAKALHQDLEMGIGEAREMLRMPNNERDTALHEAVRNNHLDVVKILTEEDPDFSYSANEAEETPLYLAAERGYHQVVAAILGTCTSPAHGGPNGRTSLHGAVIGGDKEITRMILEKKSTLTKEVDLQRWTPLHYAAFLNHPESVFHIQYFDVSAAYYADNDEKQTPLHLAARRGNSESMNSIMKFSPACCELVDKKGRNILHLAIQSKSENAIRVVLKNPSLSNLLNEKDADGNTPLHLLAASSASSLPELIRHPKVDKMALNKKNLTALDILATDVMVANMKVKREIQRYLRSSGCKHGWRNAICNDDISDLNKIKDEEYIPDLERIGDEEDDPFLKKAKSQLEKAKESHQIVAALIATVTFTAGFTLPGGFISDEDPNQGSAILRKNSAFKAFVIFDTLAMVFSTSAVFFYFFMALETRIKRLFWYFRIAVCLALFAIAGMILAFVTSTYAVLAHSSGLAVATCVLGLLFFVFFFILLKKRFIKTPKVGKRSDFG